MTNKVYEKIKNYIKENYKTLIMMFLIIFIFNFEWSYKVEIPGGFISLKERIKIDNEYESQGEFGMAYVSMVRGSLPFLLVAQINDNWDIIDKSNLTYDDETMKEMNRRDELSYLEAIDNATINAYKYANKEYNITSTKVYVTHVLSEDTDLQLFDEIIKINDKEVYSLEDIKNIVKDCQINDYVKLLIKRDDKEIEAKTKVFSLNDEPKIGIGVIVDKELDTNPNLDIKVKRNESGPSGGLMMSLAIYDSLIEEDLTKGLKIIGTGTIDENGNVGEIGGVKYKLIGAVKKKAKVFLCPKENYEEAINIVKEKKYNIKVIGVSTFEEALEELRKL